jgi:hypothetical protein
MTILSCFRAYSLRTLILLTLLGLPLFIVGQPVSPGCDWAKFDRETAEMRAARDAAIQVVTPDGDTDVSPEAIKQIQAFKNGIFAAYQDLFLCQSDALPEAKDLQKEIDTRLGLSKPKPETTAGQPDDGPWKGLLLTHVEIKLDVVSDVRKLIAIRTKFDVPYGDDSELDVFSRTKDEAWKPVIHFTSRPYARIDGAFTGFDYRISPPDEKGEWFVVTSYINPWPTSCWQTLTVDALHPDEYFWTDSIFHQALWGYVCADDEPYIRQITSKTFQFAFGVTSIDEGSLESKSLQTYRVEGDEVTRIQPVASDSVNFADEWTRSKWAESRDWSATEGFKLLSAAHHELHGGTNGDFTELRSCSMPHQEQVGYETILANGNGGPSWYFRVKHVGNAYTMMRVNRHPDLACHGQNRISSVEIK